MDQTWLEKLKIYTVEVLLKKVGPAASASLISALLAILAAHQGLLETWGITFGTWPLSWDPGSPPSGHVILIELDTIGPAALALLSTMIVSFFTAAQHHVAATVLGAPQIGVQKPANIPASPKAP